MPVYDYRCKQCKKTFEKILKISEIEDYVPEAEFDCCEKQCLQRYMPSDGAANIKKGHNWGGGKGNW